VYSPFIKATVKATLWLSHGPRVYEKKYLAYRWYLKYSRWAWWVVVTIFMCLLVAARTFLVVEAFASMRLMPDDVYKKPGEWWKVIPHIS